MGVSFGFPTAHKNPILVEIGVYQHLRQFGLVSFVIGFNKPVRGVKGLSLLFQSAKPSDLLFGSQPKSLLRGARI